MRFSGIRLPLLAASACASVGLFVWETDRTYGDTVYLLPTSGTVSVSTPYVVASSYVLPSSYVFPSYIESAYRVSPSVSLLPTGYIETTYRRGLFGRRWVVERPVVAAYSTAYVPTTYLSTYVPTTYVPTTYVSPYVGARYVAPTYYATSYRARAYRPTSYTYYPTLYETAYASAADICCDEVVVDSTIRTVPQSSVGSYSPARRPKEVESGSMDEGAYDSIVNTPLPSDTAKQRSTLRSDGTTNAQPKGDAARADSPPNAPLATAEEEAESKAATKAAGTPKNAPGQKSGGAPGTKKGNPPAAPADESEGIDLRPAPADGEVTRRDSMKALYPRLRSADRRNILFGTVETDDGQPRDEVPITVVNRNNSVIRRTGVSNAFGTFAIRVPDGQWTVRVTMPSGNTQPVRDITVNGGRVVDIREAKEVQNLIISY